MAGGVQSMLDTVLGKGNAVVSVTAELDFDQSARTTETYSASDPTLPPINSATSVEDYTGTGQTVGGVLGVDGSVTSPTSNPTDGTGKYHKESATVNNPINKVTEQLTTAPGTVRRQSVSVIVSDALKGVDMTALQASIAAAAGIDTTRGDVVSVTQMPFDTSTATQAQEALAAADQQAKADRTAGLIKTGAIGGVRAPLGDPAGVHGACGAPSVTRASRSTSATSSSRPPGRRRSRPPVKRVPCLRHPRVDSRRDDVMAMAAEQPAEVAEVLRGWLTAGRS